VLKQILRVRVCSPAGKQQFCVSAFFGAFFGVSAFFRRQTAIHACPRSKDEEKTVNQDEQSKA